MSNSRDAQDFIKFNLLPGNGEVNCFKWAAQQLDQVGIIVNSENWITRPEHPNPLPTFTSIANLSLQETKNAKSC